MAGGAHHEPVMAKEVLEWLRPRPGNEIADLTLGLAGHSRQLLERLRPGGRLLGIDADPESVALAGELLGEGASDVELLIGHFDEVVRRLPEGRRFDGVLLDLGISSVQMDSPERGFGFLRDGPLDMRLDRSRGRTAADLLARTSQAELEALFREYGQERFARRVAREIVAARRRRPLRRTVELAELVAGVVSGRSRQRIHPATRVFQALRIAVNDELGRLERALEGWASRLEPGGRIVVISFHSLEDGRVKRFFREQKREGLFSVLTPKPQRPTYEEVMGNPRARSARLRCAERSTP